MKQAILHSARTSKPREFNQYECGQFVRYAKREAQVKRVHRADSRSIYEGRMREIDASMAGLEARLRWNAENEHRLLRVFA